MSASDLHRGMEALTRLLLPARNALCLGERRTVPEHVQGYIDAEFATLSQWMESVFARGVCPATQRPLDQCDVCSRQQPAPPKRAKTDWEIQLRDSPFVQGTERQKPHLDDLGEAILAVLRKVRNLYSLAQ